MRLLIGAWLFCLMGYILTGCQEVTRSYRSQNYKQDCQQKCQEKYGTDVDWIGAFSGTCYCK